MHTNHMTHDAPTVNQALVGAGIWIAAIGLALTQLYVQAHPPVYALGLVGAMAAVILRDLLRQQNWPLLYSVAALILTLTTIAMVPWGGR